MKRNIAILNRIYIAFIILLFFSCSKKKCYDCTYFYYPGTYYNSATHDTIVLTLISKNYGLDTLTKYYKLGYLRTGNGGSEFIHDNLCDEEIDSLSKIGVNYNCKY